MAETREHTGAASADAPLECLVVTPEATVFEHAARFVALPLIDGEMRVLENGRTARFYVDGGFVQVANNVVSVLTNRALPSEQIDLKVAAELLATARARPANTPELLAIRDRIELQARAQLRIAQR